MLPFHHFCVCCTRQSHAGKCTHLYAFTHRLLYCSQVSRVWVKNIKRSWKVVLAYSLPYKSAQCSLSKSGSPSVQISPSSLLKSSFDAHTKLFFTHPPSQCCTYSIHTCLLPSQQLSFQLQASAPFSPPSGSLGEASCPKKFLSRCSQTQEGQAQVFSRHP